MTTLPVAGEPYALVYSPRLAGAPVDVTSVDSVDLYADDARSVLVLRVDGPAVREALGRYVFPPAIMPAAGLYPARVTYTVGATVRTDDETLLVYAFDGRLEAPGAAPVLLSPEHVDPELDQYLAVLSERRRRQLLLAVDELVEQITGPLPAPDLIPARYREAAVIIALHLTDRFQGAIPASFQGGTDVDGTSGTYAGFAIPRAARELLVVRQASAARGPAGSFPAAQPWPAS